MKHLFKQEMIKSIFSIFLLLLVVKVLWFTVEMLWLPSAGVEHVEEKSGKALYYRVKLTPNEAPAPTIKKKKSTKVIGSIKDIILLAIYNASDATVITVEHKKKTKVLSRGEEINGFVLEGGSNNFAIFSKKLKTYKVYLTKDKKSTKNRSSIKKTVQASPPIVKSKISKVQGEIVDAGDHRIIDKSLVEHYSKSLKDIAKNIGMVEQKRGDKLEGFRVTFIRRSSHFSKLGLQKGDVIKSINGQEINSYNDAMNVYKNINTMDSLSLTIKRGKEEMELEYEVN